VVGREGKKKLMIWERTRKKNLVYTQKIGKGKK